MKILEVCAKLNIGGAQAVAANISKYADEDMFFTYLVFGEEVGELEDEIISKGHTVLHVNAPSSGVVKFVKYLVWLMKSEKYDVVHAHTMFNCGLVMLAAKIAGVPGRLSHSHTVDDEAGKSLVRRLYRFIMRRLIRCFGNEYLACGVDAGCKLYGKQKFEKKGSVIKNGISISDYQYSEKNREAIRKKYAVTDKFVIGHVGHYVSVKNQKFLISLMPEILKQQRNAVLLMFGDGEDRSMLEKLIENNGLEEHVKLIGSVNNISEVLSAFDVFAFPSLFEGTPLALIEAQANGVPCIISDLIPKDAWLTEAITPISLENEKAWINAIASAERKNSAVYAEQLQASYGDIRESMQKLYGVFRKYEKS